VELTDASTVAGRAPENKIVIDDKQASRRHFTIDKIEYGYKVVDLESRNGTRVNDRQVNQMLLRPGDKIQIGKHVLTFEDPNFKEPPPEVAAKLAPTGPPPAAVPAAAPGAPAPLPVATEAPKPVVLAAPPPPPPEDYRSKRNRSGHTTAVQKNVQVQLQEESKTLTLVAIGAGIFIFVILLLIFLPSGANPAGDPAALKPGLKLPPGISETERAEKEAREWDELSTFCERNKTFPNQYPEIIKRVDEFEKNNPRSPNGAKARDYKASALAGIKTSKNAEYSEAERIAQESLKRNDFGNGLKQIRDLLARYKTDADIHERLVKLKEQAVDDARVYFKAKSQEADAMKFSRKDEARDAYESLLKLMGNGSVPELDDYCKIVRIHLEGLQ
jgi:pSer/pThr/pTyr-binding forkhead associated (FHA) protein